VNLKTSEGFTCVHYAAFKGNLVRTTQPALKVVVENGGDLKAKNQQELDAMQVAAQGDRALMIAWLAEQGLDPEIADKNGSTPLHWACFMGNEEAASVLLALGVRVDLQDSQGQTALHLATSSSSSRIMKSLLFKGASRQIKVRGTQDSQGRRALDVALNKELYKLTWMLNEPGLLSDCTLRTPLKPYKRSNCLLYLIMTLVQVCSVTVVCCASHDAISFSYLSVYLGLSVLTGTLLVLTHFRDPGYLLPAPGSSLVVRSRQKLYSKFDIYNVCPQCCVFRKSRARHCQCCNRCVEKFDHHCPWINNCIGARNLGLFYVTLWTAWTWLAFTLGIIGWYCSSNSESGQLLDVDHGTAFIGLVCLGSVAVVFFFPLSFLLLVQTQNFLLNRTTNERFSHSNRAGLNESVIELQHSTTSACDNFKDMCLNRQGSKKKNSDTELKRSFHYSELKRNFEEASGTTHDI
jgi:palmitoyltransferase